MFKEKEFIMNYELNIGKDKNGIQEEEKVVVDKNLNLKKLEIIQPQQLNVRKLKAGKDAYKMNVINSGYFYK